MADRMSYRICGVVGWILLLGLLSGPVLRADDPVPAVSFLKTTGGIPFAILGEKPKAPAPTLLVFGADMRNTLIGEDVNRLGRLLIPHGYLCVSLDLPCHGTDTRPGEKSGDLAGWKTRVVNGENIVTPFCGQTTGVLDYLVAEGYTDPAQVAVSGTSRGGFFAFHCAAADSRIQQVIAFAPVTHLPALAEFAGAETNPLALSLSPVHVAHKLVGKPLWIVIGNQDLRVSTDDCLALGLEVIKLSKGKRNPIPVELRLVGTIGHRLHAVPTPEFGQLCAPHDEAARWLLGQSSKK
ncbi:MAG: prolyl oligopeptidase family serine peptidase [Planctomycetota bacterium]